MLTIVETTVFERKAADSLNEEELEALKAFLARNPEQGVIVPGTGGVRKLRWSASGRGKRFTKAAKSDLSADEKARLAKIVEGIKEEIRKKS